MTIVSLRGTHGSGKSSVVKAILGKYPSWEIMGRSKAGRPRPEGYAVKLPTGWLYVRGPYHTACGGCDAIQPYADIWPQIEDRMDVGVEFPQGTFELEADHVVTFSHCLFEGALVSSGYGNLGRATEKYGDDVVFAFLDTPLHICLERIAARRAKRWAEQGKPGEPPPVNPDNTTSKHVMVEKSIKQIAALGRRTVIIDYRKPVQQVMKLFGVTLRKEP